MPHIELDAIHHGPNWAEPTPTSFARRWTRRWQPGRLGDRRQLRGETRRDRAAEADTIVWLDLPLQLTLGRIAGGRPPALRSTELWNGNRETLRNVLWGRDSLFAWAIARHREYRRTLPAAFAQPAYRDKDVIRLRSERDVRAWLDRVSRSRVAGAA